MLPIERQHQIITWLEKERTLTVSELSKRLSVSEMTIYRDIKPLIEQNKVTKTSRGISYVNVLPTGNPHCSYCYKEPHPRHSMQLIMESQQIEHACCPHCGLLRYADVKERVSHVLCKDFLSGTTVSAKTAYFLIDADLDMHCCKPYILVFESAKQAKQFQKGFGGTIFLFEEMINEVTRRMKQPGTPPHCH